MYPKKNSSGVYWIHIWAMNEPKNCFYVYNLNATFIDVLIYLSYFFISIERASDCESINIKMKYIIEFNTIKTLNINCSLLLI